MDWLVGLAGIGRHVRVGFGFDEHMDVKQIYGTVSGIIIILPPPDMRHVLGQPLVHESNNFRMTEVVYAPQRVVLDAIRSIICNKLQQKY